MALDPMESEILEAVSRRGFGARWHGFWTVEALRSPQLPVPELVSRFAKFEAELMREWEAAEQAALLRFRAEFQPLDHAARTKKWEEEKERWTSWLEEARPVVEAIEAVRNAPRTGELRFQNSANLANELRGRVDAWRRKQGLAGPAPAEPRNEALEAQIERDPDAEEPFLVYADWLLSQGNERGELISLARKAQEKSFRQRRAPQFLGRLAPFGDRLQMKWRLGFLEALELETLRDDEGNGIDLLQLIEAAHELASTRFLRDLTIACPSVHEGQLAARLPAALAAGGVRPTMRSLSFVTNLREELLPRTSAGELSGYAQLFPNLQTLHVHAGSFSLTRPHFPRLRKLVLQTWALSPKNLQAIIDADWPELERLEVWLSSASTLAQVETLLASKRLPKLTSLGLCNCEFTDELCVALLASPLLPRLRSVSLAKGTMTEVGSSTLSAGAAKLTGLEELDVDDNYLDYDALSALRKTFSFARSANQRTPEVYEGQPRRHASVGGVALTREDLG